MTPMGYFKKDVWEVSSLTCRQRCAIRGCFRLERSLPALGNDKASLTLDPGVGDSWVDSCQLKCSGPNQVWRTKAAKMYISSSQ